MRLACLGGAGEIGANSYYLEVGSSGILLDAGLHPKKEGRAALPRLDVVADLDGDVDHIVVTHAHLDHVGALPFVHRRFRRARIHLTPTAWRFAARMLRNSANVLLRRSKGGEAPPLYGFEEVEALDGIVETHPLGVPFSLGRGVTGTFYDAGHIPGAAGVLLRDDTRAPGARTLFYTGDTCGSAQLLLPGARYPEGPIDVLLTESTYGGNLVAEPVDPLVTVGELGRLLAPVLARGGVALIPVFALGRAQEVLQALSLLRSKNQLSRAIPLYLTGLARAVTRLYDDTRREASRSADVRLEAIGFQVLEAQAIAAGAPEGPAVVLASSGMLLAETASNALARRVLPLAEDAVFIVGYQDPDSPGYRVQHSAAGDAIDLGDGRPPVERRATLERIHFRAHSTRSELIAAARHMKPGRAVLVHGDPASSRSLGEELRASGAEPVYPEPAEPIHL